MHERFDLSHWQRVYAELDPAELSDRYWPPGLGVAGPCDVCALEHRRAQLRNDFELGRAVPADVFVFALGEPNDRSVTKIGGVPYRPANLPWPRISFYGDYEAIVAPDEELASLFGDDDLSGIMRDYGSLDEYYKEEFPYLRFLGQFNFTDSLDLVGPLPGDVLLLFGDYGWPYIHYYEWHPLGIADLVEPAGIPTTGYSGEEGNFVTCYGQIHRTCDYPEADRTLLQLEEPFSETFGREAAFRIKAHRIGGAPYLIQAEPDIPGRVICVFDGVSASTGVAWPWVNVQTPIVRGAMGRSPIVRETFVDLSGSIYLSIDESGKLHWIDQCT